MSLQEEKDLTESEMEEDFDILDEDSNHAHMIYSDVLKYKIKVDDKNHEIQLAKKETEIENIKKENYAYRELIGSQNDKINKNERTIRELKRKELELEEKIKSLIKKEKQQKEKSNAVCKAQAEQIKQLVRELSLLREKMRHMEDEKERTDEKLTLMSEQMRQMENGNERTDEKVTLMSEEWEEMKKVLPPENMIKMFKMVEDMHRNTNERKDDDSKIEGNNLNVQTIHNLQIGHQAGNKMEPQLPPIKFTERGTNRGNMTSRSLSTPRSNPLKAAKKK